MKRILASLVVVLSVACQQLPVSSDGALPAEAMGRLTGLVGTYSGALQLHSGRSRATLLSPNFAINLELQGNKPVLVANQDILGAGCDSSIGKLVGLQLGGAWDVVASFEFDAGNCPELAHSRHGGTRHLTIYAQQDGERVLMTLYKKSASFGSRPRHRETFEYRSRLRKHTSN